MCTKTICIVSIKSQSDSSEHCDRRAWTTTTAQQRLDVPASMWIQHDIMLERKTQFSRIFVNAWRWSGARASFLQLPPNQVVRIYNIMRRWPTAAPLCHYLTTDLNDPTTQCFIFRNIILYYYPPAPVPARIVVVIL